MPRWTIADARRLALAAGVSIAVLSIAVPLAAQASSGTQPAAARRCAMVGPSAQQDHVAHRAAVGGAAGVDAEIARLLSRMDETTGDERMAVMTELITVLVEDRAARMGTPAATTAAPMCAMCAEPQAGGGGQMCATCAEHHSAGNDPMCSMCAAQHPGTSDHSAGAPTTASCCAGHK